MSKVTDNYAQLAMAIGLRSEGQVIYGERNGYSVMIQATDNRYPYLLTVYVTAEPITGIYLSKEELKQFAKDNKPVFNLTQKENILAMVVKNTSNQQKLKEVMNEALNALTSFLVSKGYQTSCQFCKQTGAVQAYQVGTGHMQICPECAARFRQDATLAAKHHSTKNENTVAGIVGALLGSVLGVLCIIIFSQMGFVAAISGFVMAVCTLKGYELLGGKLTGKSIAICVILMIIMTYVGDRIDWAIMIAREWELDFATSFAIVPNLLSEGYIETSSYVFNLLLIYVFTIGGAVPTIKSAMNEQKNASIVRPLGGVDLNNL